MSYRHFGRFGDIWKHLPLCEFLKFERPSLYIETNAAYPQYELSQSAEQKYGVYLVERNLERSAAIKESAWWQSLQSAPANAKRLTKYLGSPALAMSVLAQDTGEFVFFDIEREALQELQHHTDARGLSSRVQFRNEDSVSGLAEMADSLSPSAFVHIDPYWIHEENSEGQTYFDGFRRAAAAGAKCMLWYGFKTPMDLDYARKGFRTGQKSGSLSAVGIELIAAPFGSDPAPVDPGVLGCGILVANLSHKSVCVFKKYAREVVEVYRGSHMMENFPGDLRSNEFELRI